VSGTGLWRFSLARLSESEIEPFDFQLAGVAFNHLPDTDDGIATVRFHGPHSIYEQLLPKVRKSLGSLRPAAAQVDRFGIMIIRGSTETARGVMGGVARLGKGRVGD
jgi:hypothetical protein